MRLGSPNALKNGLFMGVMLIICSYVLYLTDNEGFIIYKSWVLFLPYLILLYKTGSDARRLNGGWIEFNSAFKDIYVAAIIGMALCTMFEYVLYNIISPELKTMLKEISMEKMGEMFSSEMVDTLQSQMSEEQLYSIGYTISTYIVRLIAPGLIFSLFVSMITKRQKPILSNETKQL